jgi:plasmid stabilization system protein ParE
MKVTFEPAARDELDDIFAWIAKDNPRAALEMIARIEEKVMRLANPELTHMGLPNFIEGRVDGRAGSLPARGTNISWVIGAR